LASQPARLATNFELMAWDFVVKLRPLFPAFIEQAFPGKPVIPPGRERTSSRTTANSSFMSFSRFAPDFYDITSATFYVSRHF
jgi:hypothetical protein